MKLITIIFIGFLAPVYAANPPANVEGIVFEDINKNGRFDVGEPLLEGVLISNGKEVIKTDKNGRYLINKLTDIPVFIIKPSGYQSRLKSNSTADFYLLDNGIGIRDFPLYTQDEGSNHNFVLLGDLQVDVRDDIHHVEKLVVEELIQDPPDLIFPLGDLSFDNLDIFKPLAASLALIGSPVYYVIGNHDMDFDSQTVTQRDASFKREFGPSYYALEYGEQVIVVLNNIMPTGDRNYVGGLDQTQKIFLTNLLSNYSPRKITVMMHIPIEFMDDRDEFLKILEKHDEVFVAVGHTHTQYHKYFERAAKPPIHQLVAGAVCGSWWQGPHDMEGIPYAMMYDGTWKGYWYLTVEDNKQRLRYKVSGRDANKQMDIWVPEYQEWDTSLEHLNDGYIYANVFAADSATKVDIRFDEGPWISMQQHSGVAPAYRRLIDLQNQGRFKNMNISSMSDANLASSHLWRYAPPAQLTPKPMIVKIRAYSHKMTLNHTVSRVYHHRSLSVQ